MNPYDHIKNATAGTESAGRIRDMLGLTVLFLEQNNLTTGPLEFFRDAFKITITTSDGVNVPVTIFRSSSPRVPDTLEISMEGNQVPRILLKWREAAVVQIRRSGLNLITLEKELLSDPESSIKASSMQEIPSTMRRWGKENQWRIFFCDRELEQMGNKNFIDAMAQNKVLQVRHTDHECVQTPVGTGFLNFTNRRFRYDNIQRDSLDDSEPEYSRLKLSTDLNDMDVVQGNTGKKLDCIMDCIRDDFKGVLTVFVNCCVPMLTGDDIQHHVREMQQRDDLYFVFLDQMLSSAVKPFLEPLIRIKNSPGFFDVAPVPNTINLVGYEMDRSMEEMLVLLEEIGIHLNLCIFPEYPLKKFKSYMAASLQVAFSTELFQGVFHDFFNNIPMKTIFPERPFGVESTKEWFRAIAGEFGKIEQFDNLWNEYFPKFGSKIAELRKQASQYRVGVILDVLQLERFFDSDITLGIPLPGAIENMGFGIDFLIYSDIDELYEARKQFITSRLEHPEFHSIRRFHTPSDLDSLLTNASFNAVYSDFFFDTRLTRQGLPQFSIDVFEKGVEGNIRSLQRILKICRLPFYSKYGKYLKDVPDGVNC